MPSTWDYLRQEGNYNGHRFWRNPAGDVAITDNSLRESGHPETTHDGLLLVDRKRPITIGPGAIPLIPITDATGRPFVSPGSEGDVEFCTKRLGLVVEKATRRW